MGFVFRGGPAVLAGLCLVLLATPGDARTAFRPGVELGVNVSSLSYDDERAFPIPYWDHHWRPSLTGGVTLEIPFRERWSVATGLRYVQEGNRVTFDVGGTVGEFRIAQHYVGLPVRAAWRPFPARNVVVAVGPEVAFLVSGRSVIEYSSPPATSSSSDITDALDRVHLALEAETGVEFPLQGRTGCVTLRYAHGLTADAKRNNWASDWKTRGIECLLGFEW